jgi:hypothetical protein
MTRASLGRVVLIASTLGAYAALLPDECVSPMNELGGGEGDDCERVEEGFGPGIIRREAGRGESPSSPASRDATSGASPRMHAEGSSRTSICLPATSST